MSRYKLSNSMPFGFAAALSNDDVVDKEERPEAIRTARKAIKALQAYVATLEAAEAEEGRARN